MEPTSVSGADVQGLSQVEVCQLLKQLSDMLHQHDLPADSKDEALLYLGAARKAAEKEEPNKSLTAGNLKSMTETIQTANKTLESSKSLWTNLAPILSQLPDWLGVAKDFFGL
jgi:hypothetical protein